MQQKKTLYSYTVVAVVVLLLSIAYNERTLVKHLFRSKHVHLSAAQSSSRVSKKVLEVLESQDIHPEEYTFIDVGCGDAVFMTQFAALFKQCIGVELNPSTAEVAKKVAASYDNIRVINIDMVDYDFDHAPSPAVVFMHEPLWLLHSRDARPIYDKLFDKMDRFLSRDDVYVFYVNGVYRKKHMPDSFFVRRGIEVLEKHSVGSFMLRKQMKVLKKK